MEISSLFTSLVGGKEDRPRHLSTTERGPMIHSTKIAVVVNEDLLTWQKLNATACLAAGVAVSQPTCIGDIYEDASGNSYLPIIGQPVFVYLADNERLHRTRLRAKSRGVQIALYAKSVFLTDNDVDNRAGVRVVHESDLDLAGIALRAEGKIFSKIVSGLELHE